MTKRGGWEPVIRTCEKSGAPKRKGWEVPTGGDERRRGRLALQAGTLGRAWTRAQYVLFRFCFAVLGALPLPVAMLLGALAARAYIAADRRRRRIGLTNLAIAFPASTPSRRRRILRASFANLGRTIAECAHLHRLTPTNIRRFIGFEDEQYWRRALEILDNSGALIVSGHFGNWELFHYAHALLGYPVHLVHRPIKNPLIDAFIERVRTRSGTIVHPKEAAARGVLNALKGRRLVVIPLDQNASGKMGVFVEFFGLPASTNSGLARLALRTGAPVFPAFLVREGTSARHRIVVYPPIKAEGDGDLEEAIRNTTQRYVRAIEEIVRKYPEQWLWTHKRWRTRPVGEPEVYR